MSFISLITFLTFRAGQLYLDSLKSKALKKHEESKSHQAVFDSLCSGVLLFSGENCEEIEFCNLKCFESLVSGITYKKKKKLLKKEYKEVLTTLLDLPNFQKVPDPKKKVK